MASDEVTHFTYKIPDKEKLDDAIVRELLAHEQFMTSATKR